MIMKNRAVILTLTLLVAVVLTIGNASAKTIHEEVTIKPVKTISPAEESIISSATVKVVRHIAKARGAIHGKDLEQAGIYLKKAARIPEQLLLICGNAAKPCPILIFSAILAGNVRS